jgi:hypothetical protein
LVSYEGHLIVLKIPRLASRRFMIGFYLNAHQFKVHIVAQVVSNNEDECITSNKYHHHSVVEQDPPKGNENHL